MSNMLDVPEVRAAAVRLTPAQYHRLHEIGVVPERTELLSGILVEKIPKSPLHTWMVAFLHAWLGKIIDRSLHIRPEQPLTLHDSEPEPGPAHHRPDTSTSMNAISCRAMSVFSP